jgi:prophage regulatory protein
MKKVKSTGAKPAPSDKGDAIGSMPERILTLPEVLLLYPVSRSTWYQGIDAGIFPRCIKLSDRRVGWQLGAILELIESKMPGKVAEQGAELIGNDVPKILVRALPRRRRKTRRARPAS